MISLLRKISCLALIALAACAPVSEQPVLKVIATDPGADAVLGMQQRFYLQFSVTAKTPLVVTLEPYFQREALSVNLGTSAPVTLPAGGGTAAAHLFFWGDHATRVDEIRLVARAPKESTVRAELALPVKLSWVAREMPPRETPAWVAETQKSGAPSAREQRSEWIAFGAVILAIALGGFGSRWLRKRWRARDNDGKTPPAV
jgi:hypothetical protein